MVSMKPAIPNAGRTTGTLDQGLSAREGRFFWFLVIGIVSTLVDISFLYIFTEFLSTYYLLSATASYCCGILVNYALNKHITFHDATREYLRQFLVFAIISVSSLILNIVVLYIAVDLFAVQYLAGKGLAIITSLFWNYFGQSRITFRPD